MSMSLNVSSSDAALASHLGCYGEVSSSSALAEFQCQPSGEALNFVIPTVYARISDSLEVLISRFPT